MNLVNLHLIFYKDHNSFHCTDRMEFCLFKAAVQALVLLFSVAVPE